VYSIFKDFSFSAAHSIRGHTRGCERMHGHNYRVRVHLRAARLDALGMVLDFADLKAIMQEILGPFDHRVINEVAPFDERNTTAELLAEYVWTEVSRRLPEDPSPPPPAAAPPPSPPPSTTAAAPRRLEVVRVEVWENDTACAAYEP
jgi:6-pyruvoyltetrahydropterin/6-carboxytetrahydropterin synthase